MAFSPLLVTNQGLNALAEVGGTGATLTVTKVEAGSGYATGGDIPGNFTQLKNYVMDCDSTSTNTEVLYQTTIRCNISPQNVPKVFQVNELGVFASLNNQAPFLFAYASTGAPTGDTADPSVPVVREYVLPVVYSTLQSVSTTINMTDVVGLHGGTHLPNGIDPLPIASNTIGGLTPKTTNEWNKVLVGYATAAWDHVPVHGWEHCSGQRDPMPVATTYYSGALPQLSGDPNTVLLGTGVWGAGFFPGFITEYAGYWPPAGWLVCDGQAYSRSTYGALYSALGASYSPWGQGDGWSTFNVPDLRGRVSIASGQGPGLSNHALGFKGGEENHQLSYNELASHTHGVNDPTHAHAVWDPTHAHAIYDPGHTHSLWNSPHTHGVNDPAHSHAVYDPQHSHGVSDPTHAHGVADPGHSHDVNDPTHAHGVSDPGHVHYLGYIDHKAKYDPSGPPVAIYVPWSSGNPWFTDGSGGPAGPNAGGQKTGVGIYGSGTGISINSSHTGIGISSSNTNIAIYNAQTNLLIYNANTGISVKAASISMGASAATTGLGIYGAYTGIALYGAATGISIQAAGSSWAHNNMQPYAVVTKIIKT
jgi:microcystin-dependent protein